MRPEEPLALVWRVGLACLCLGAGYVSLAPIGDGDTFFHLALGRWMLDHRALLPSPDPFVWVARGAAEAPHEWLAQLAMALVDRAAGLTGLRVLAALCVGGTLALLFGSIWRSTREPATALLASALAYALIAPHVAMRPHLLGWLFLVVVFGFVTHNDGSWSRGRYAVLVLTLVAWANCHASVLIAPALLGLHGLALLVDADASDRRAVATRWAGRAALALACALVQPAGPGLIPYVLHSPSVLRGLSAEWGPLLSLDVWESAPGALISYAVLATAALCAVLPRRGRAGAIEALVLVLAVASTRRMTVLLLLPILRLAPRLASHPAWQRLRLRTAIVATAVALTLVSALPRAILVPSGIDLLPATFPTNAIPVLDATRLQGRLLSPDGWGGFLEAHLGPETPVYADGRWVLVGRQAIEDMLAFMLRREPVETRLDGYGIDWVVQRWLDYRRAPPLNATRWALAWQDSMTVVLLRRTPAFDDNVARVCRFYATHPELRPQAHWPGRLVDPRGGPTPTDVPSVLTACPARDPPSLPLRP